MGAMLYIHVTPYASPLDALTKIQADVVAKSYDLRTLVSTQLEAARTSLEEIGDDDEYGLKDDLDRQIAFLEKLSKRPLPELPTDRIAYVKAAFKFDECGMGNILDLRGVAETQELFMAAPVDESTLVKINGNSRPSPKDVEKICYALNEKLGRGECLYFPVYSDANTSPSELCFVGNTVD